ncbi:Cof-type HAD-IIB family hydrolase [Alkaliphilus crotonatoxidans]
MNYRLLATDMDGTLLKDNKTISKENLRAIHEAVDLGMELVICTGRPFGALKPYLTQIGFPCWLVTNNGAVIRDKGGRIVRQINLKQAVLKKVLAILNDAEIYYHGADINYTYIRSYKERIKLYHGFMRNHGLNWPQASIKALSTIFLKDSHRRININEYANQGVQLNSLFIYDENPEKLMEVKKALEEIPEIQITSSGKNNLEILDPMATKGSALSEVAKTINIDPEEIMAVGDQLNDLSMIKFAGLGIAMANAEEAVLKAADWVTKSNEENGIQYLLKKKILDPRKQLGENPL